VTYKEWEEKYSPVKNSMGCVREFDTTGPDFLEVQAANPDTVWTECCEGESWYIYPGLRFCNRMCYYITEKPCLSEDKDAAI